MEAARIAALFWWMAIGTAVVVAIVVALALAAARAAPERATPRRINLLIVGGGVAVPVIVLGALLAYGLSMMPSLLARPPANALRVHVAGEQWWWRVRYVLPNAEPVDLANEVRLPVGEPVEFVLTSDNVIHAFWIPSLGGKRDMIPGRVTTLTLTPTRTGTFRGACAEYCGTSHALMAFAAVVQERAAFEQWLDAQRQPARPPAGGEAARGRALFAANGCGACHTIRGTEANGVLAPDLTHVGSRLSLGAGTLPTSSDAFARWIGRTHVIKPDVQMPHFGMLPEADRSALAAYLSSLR